MFQKRARAAPAHDRCARAKSTCSSNLRCSRATDRFAKGGFPWAGNRLASYLSDIPGRHGTCNVSGSTATWASGDAWSYAGTATGDSELVNKEILIGGSQVTITAISSDGSTITTSPAPPSGSGQPFQVITMCFRVQRWSLKKDWSVQIEAQTVTASMYDLDVGPKPMDVAPAPCQHSSIRFRSARHGTVPGAGTGGYTWVAIRVSSA